MIETIRLAAKSALAPVLYRYPPFNLQPARLAYYITALLDRAHLDADVAEVGCSAGGTAIVARKALAAAGWKGQYTCFDTFGGFISEQYDKDVESGLAPTKRHKFSANSVGLVRRIIQQHGRGDIQLVQGDATKLRPEDLSHYSVVLADIDLAEPSYEVMKIFWPRLVPGGILLCDDCGEDRGWLAGDGYRKFCAEMNLPEEYYYGLGIARKSE
jgi:O-methyltransferase